MERKKNKNLPQLTVKRGFRAHHLAVLRVGIRHTTATTSNQVVAKKYYLVPVDRRTIPDDSYHSSEWQVPWCCMEASSLGGAIA